MTCWMTLLLLALPVTDSTDATDVIIVLGASGTEAYAAAFSDWTDKIEDVSQRAGASVAVIGRGSRGSIEDKEVLERAIRSRKHDSTEPLWIILIGHGTYDGKKAKFNLRGPDVSSQELSEWIDDIQRPIAIVNCASASAPFINDLAGPNRIIVTSTKSGYEQNYSRFGAHFSEGLANPKADLDKDEQTSLLEAFLYASYQVTEFFEAESRLATEHALIDDNGDGKGTPFEWFRGVRVTKQAKDQSIPDGIRANQIHLIPSDAEKRLDAETRKRRDMLEISIEQLRQKKSSLSQEEYYERLETLVSQLAYLYWPDHAPPARDDAAPNHDALDPDTTASEGSDEPIDDRTSDDGPADIERPQTHGDASGTGSSPY